MVFTQFSQPVRGWERLGSGVVGTRPAHEGRFCIKDAIPTYAPITNRCERVKSLLVKPLSCFVPPTLTLANGEALNVAFSVSVFVPAECRRERLW